MEQEVPFTTEHLRIPSIKFIGKRSLAQQVPAVQSTSQDSNLVYSQAFEPSKPQTGVDFFSLNERGWFGRPRLSTAEVEAIESGGATMV